MVAFAAVVMVAKARAASGRRDNRVGARSGEAIDVNALTPSAREVEGAIVSIS